MANRRRPSKIVVGVDGSDASERALLWAIDEAARRGASVEAVHTWQVPAYVYEAFGAAHPTEDWELDASRVMDAAMERLGDHPEARVEASIRQGRPADILLAEADDPDTALMVVGTRRHGADAELILGSTSQACVHHSRCPVVVVP
jgi:nucleotide-binding universal stress UspA family protein